MVERVARLIAVATLGMLLAAPAAAQQPLARPGQGGARGVGFVRGVVYDSLLRAPLDSAHVYIDGTSLGTMTDAGGRFRLDSVPAGRQVIVFEHPDLDSAGLASIARRIEVTAGRATVVELAVPSLATMRRAACAPSPNPTRDSGLVYGAVSDAARGMRLAGARVSVTWVAAGRGPDGRVAVSRPGLDARTDSLGNYYVCGVPTEYVLTVEAQAGRFTSGRTELLIGRRRVARRDVALSRDTLSLPDSTGQRRGTAILVGRVRDEHDSPRPSARVAVDDAAAGEAYADSAGRFVLQGLPAGSHMVMVRMIGYSATRVPVLLKDHETSYVDVRIHSVTVLDTMRITASTRTSQATLADLQDRLRIGLGYVLTEEQVKRRGSMRSVFQGLPSLMIQGRSVFQFDVFTLVSGRPCATTMYVDGIPTTTEAIQSYRPDQIIAVEWFPRGAQAPMRYQPLSSAQCSVMLVWTRFIR
jgi:hypothetical protein